MLPIPKEIWDKIEKDLIRAKETGNVSYDIKSSLSDLGYTPAVELILNEIRSPQIIPVEIKEGVGAVSARIQQARVAEETKQREVQSVLKKEEEYKIKQKEILEQ